MILFLLLATLPGRSSYPVFPWSIAVIHQVLATQFASVQLNLLNGCRFCLEANKAGCDYSKVASGSSD